MAPIYPYTEICSEESKKFRSELFLFSGVTSYPDAIPSNSLKLIGVIQPLICPPLPS